MNPFTVLSPSRRAPRGARWEKRGGASDNSPNRAVKTTPSSRELSTRSNTRQTPTVYWHSTKYFFIKADQSFQSLSSLNYCFAFLVPWLLKDLTSSLYRGSYYALNCSWSSSFTPAWRQNCNNNKTSPRDVFLINVKPSLYKGVNKFLFRLQYL